VMPLEHTLIVAEIMDSVLKQLGTVYHSRWSLLAI
jgi:hypothetical protein